MVEQQGPAGGPLDYASPLPKSPRAAAAPANGGLLIACAILVLAGAALVIAGLFADIQFTTIQVSNDDPAWVQRGGVAIAAIGLVGFLVEYARAWRASS